VKEKYSKARRDAKENQVQAVTLQLNLDRDHIEAMLQQQLNGLATELGLLLAKQFLEEEANQLCGPRYQRLAERAATRYGHQSGVITLAGQKVKMVKPRVRYTDGRGEVDLSVYSRMQRDDAMPEAALRRMVRGVSTRDYEQVVERAADAFAIKRSSVSRAFVQASAAEVQAFAERRFDGVSFVAIFVDGVEYAGETLIVVLGVRADGHKQVLGLREGGTENATVCLALLTDLRERGLGTDEPTLFVLDGAKALAKAVKEVWGRRALIQRCQVHKKRNIQGHVSKKLWPEVKVRLNEAYGKVSYSQAKASLLATVKWLEQKNPDAAASLREGLEETLTATGLGITGPLRRTLVTTNPIESVLSVVRNLTRRVRRWREGDMRQRWCTAGLLHAERKFNRVKGHTQIVDLSYKLSRAIERGWQDEEDKVA
jgi:putative transposase